MLLRVFSLSGLNYEKLKNQPKFDETVPPLLECFFRRLQGQGPVCLLAHQGNSFGFRVLQAELKRIQGTMLLRDIECADTKSAFCAVCRFAKQAKAFEDAENVKRERHAELEQQVENYPEASGTGKRKKPDSTPLAKKKYRYTKKEMRDAKEKLILKQDHSSLELHTIKKYSLKNLFVHFFPNSPRESHSVEANCINLIKICQKICKNFLIWVDENSKAFSTIKPL